MAGHSGRRSLCLRHIDSRFGHKFAAIIHPGALAWYADRYPSRYALRSVQHLSLERSTLYGNCSSVATRFALHRPLGGLYGHVTRQSYQPRRMGELP